MTNRLKISVEFYNPKVTQLQNMHFKKIKIPVKYLVFDFERDKLCHQPLMLHSRRLIFFVCIKSRNIQKNLNMNGNKFPLLGYETLKMYVMKFYFECREILYETSGSVPNVVEYC